jgi:SAM-dependent methyltransferase
MPERWMTGRWDMASYENFAAVYDTFMDNVPYRDWAAFLTGRLREYGIHDGILLDLGCGTGSLTQILAEAGYDMIGVDASSDMLEIAAEKQEKTPGMAGRILYLLQDMREFELYGTVRAVISSCDSLNYLTAEEDLLQTFRLVNNYLDPGGIFLFDMNTVYACENLLADHTFAENREDCSFIWENYYDPESMLNEYDLTLFLRADAGTSGLTDDGARERVPDRSLWRRFTETHLERAYSLDQVKKLLERAGMEYIGAFDGYSSRPCTAQSERMLILAREQGKKV